MPSVSAVASVGAPRFFRSGRGGVSGSGVLREVSGTSVLDLRGIHYVLTVVGKLNVSLGTSPFPITTGVASSIASTVASTDSGVGEGSYSTVSSVGSVSCVGVSRAMGSDVSCLQVSYLRGVDNAAIMSKRCRAVFVKTCNIIQNT